MRLWKPIAFTTFLFCAIVVTLLYSACEKNPCDHVTCDNGGSCNNGTCRCPTGYENSQCQTKSVDRFIGTYAGFSTCNNSAQFIDTAVIYADNVAINTVAVELKSLYPKVLHGYVSNNESTYSIVVTDNDSSMPGYVYYVKSYTITLQSDTRLSINAFQKSYTSVSDTLVSQCSFLGVKD